MNDTEKTLWGGNRIAHYLLFIGSPFLFFLTVINFVGVIDRFGFSARTVGEIWLSHILGGFCLFLVTYGLFAVYHLNILKGWRKSCTVIVLVIILYLGYVMLLLEAHESWSRMLVIIFGSSLMGIIAIFFGIIPSVITAILSDFFKSLILKFAPKRGRYYWMIFTVLIGVILSVVYGFILKGESDVWFFIDISLFCTLYTIFFLSLQDHYKVRNNRMSKRSFDDCF